MDNGDKKSEFPVQKSRPKPDQTLDTSGSQHILDGQELDLSNMFLVQTAPANYKQLCKLDILGLQDKPSGDQSDIYEMIQGTINLKFIRLV